MRLPLGLRAWGADRSGATALEFAIIGPVFLLVVMGVIEFGLQLMTELTLDNAVAAAARQIQIGQASSASTFVNDVCAAAGPVVASCSTSLQVYVTSGPAFSALVPASVTKSGALSATGYSPGSSGSAVLVQVAYTRAFDVPWLTQLCGGSPTLLSTFAVQQEPATS